jgi:hypothetical protein
VQNAGVGLVATLHPGLQPVQQYQAELMFISQNYPDNDEDGQNRNGKIEQQNGYPGQSLGQG